jgi:hypothetical protein
MRESTLGLVARILGEIPGVVNVAALDDEQVRRVVELESSHERKLSLPVRNLGVSLMADRDACFVVLKTATFRPPKAPSVYMVEEGGAQDTDHVLTVAGKRYTIVGQEVTSAVLPVSQPAIPLDESFVIFPNRRSGPHVPCFFLLPPLPFPELEKAGAELGLRSVISISPSLVSDAFLRETFGFPRSNSLATLLVGFDAG